MVYRVIFSRRFLPSSPSLASRSRAGMATVSSWITNGRCNVGAKCSAQTKVHWANEPPLRDVQVAQQVAAGVDHRRDCLRVQEGHGNSRADPEDGNDHQCVKQFFLKSAIFHAFLRV